MFDSLALENPKRKWATLMSFTLEAALLGITIAAPLAFTEKLPFIRFGETLVAPSGEVTRVATPVRVQAATQLITTEISDGHLVYTGHIPPKASILVDSTDTRTGEPEPFVPGGIPGQKGNPAIQNLIRSITPTNVTGPPTLNHKPLPVSHLDEGFLVHKVQPVYPQNAIVARIQGTVVLAAVIDTSGRVTQLHAVSGHPFLVPAAVEAVRQWRYKPYILNNSPVDVETQVSVVFSLNR